VGQDLADAAASGFRNGLPAGEHVLLHGDGHHGNVLDGGDRGWLAIDPQPLVGPPVLDLVPALFNGPEAPAAERVARLAGVAGVDPDELRRVSVPRLVLSVAWGLDDDGRMEADDRALRVARELL
jgi:streptomycin 6-kinase